MDLILKKLKTFTGNIISKYISSIAGFKIEDERHFKPIKSPMTDQEFRNYLDSDGHMVKPEEFRLSVYQGGVEPALRRVVWRHLLNVFPTNLSGKERFDYIKAKEVEYIKLRSQWKQLFSHDLISQEAKSVASMVKKDVLRTDRGHKFFAGGDENKNMLSLFNLLVTYALTHPEISYCQGMSDLASPLLLVQKDEAHAYLCFCGLMNRLALNFRVDGKAMTTKFQNLSNLVQMYDPNFYAYMKEHGAEDLFFCYRWLLLEMKREFPLEDALYMLEVMWSTLPQNPPQNSLALTELDFNPKFLSTSPHSPTFTMRQTLYANLLAKRRCSANLRSKDLNLPKNKVTLGAEAASYKSENNESNSQAVDPEILKSKLNMVADKNYIDAGNESTSIECSIMPNETNDCSRNRMSPSSPSDLLITENPVYQDTRMKSTKDCLKAKTITSTKDQWNEHSMQDILQPCIPSEYHSDSDGAQMQFHLSMEMPGNSREVNKRLIKSVEKIPDIKGSFFSGMMQILTSPKKRSETVKQSLKQQVSHKGKILDAHTLPSDDQDVPGISAHSLIAKSTEENFYRECQMGKDSIEMSIISDFSSLQFDEVYYANSPESLKNLTIAKSGQHESEKLLDKESEHLESNTILSGEEVSQASLSSEEVSIFSRVNSHVSFKHSSRHINCSVNCDDQDTNEQMDSKDMNSGVKIEITREDDLNGAAPLLQCCDSDNVEKSNQPSDIDSICHHVSEECGSDLTDVQALSLVGSVNEGSYFQSTRKLPPPSEFGMGNPFLMFLCLSVLMQHRDHIMKSKMEYEELAMCFDRMVRRHNVHRVLHKTRALYADYLRQHKNRVDEPDDIDPSV